MKLVECPGGIPVFLSNTESKVFDKISEGCYKHELTEREAYIVKNLVSKGLVNRTVKESKVYYSKIRGSL